MEIGAGWKKKTNKGETFLSLKIEFPGISMNVSVFPTKQKRTDKAPDYIVYWNPPKNGKPQGSGVIPNNLQEDVF